MSSAGGTERNRKRVSSQPKPAWLPGSGCVGGGDGGHEGSGQSWCLEEAPSGEAQSSPWRKLPPELWADPAPFSHCSSGDPSGAQSISEFRIIPHVTHGKFPSTTTKICWGHPAGMQSDGEGPGVLVGTKLTKS